MIQHDSARFSMHDFNGHACCGDEYNLEFVMNIDVACRVTPAHSIMQASSVKLLYCRDPIINLLLGSRTAAMMVLQGNSLAHVRCHEAKHRAGRLVSIL